MPNTVFAWEAVGATAQPMVNPVVDVARTVGVSVPAAAVVGEMTTTGAVGRVAENATVICDPAAVEVPVPHVTVPRASVAVVATTGLGGEVPAPAATAAVAVVVSHGL